MDKICKKCSGGFVVEDEDLRFYDSVSPIIGGKKFLVPAPKLCPECRQQRRLAHCNELNLFPGKCLMCGKVSPTEFTPALKQPTYCPECWHSEKWDARDSGVDFDFGRPFFEQFYELVRKTPALTLCQQGSLVNSDYIHYAGWSKNCYLIMHADYCENCMYGYGFKKDLGCVDGFYNLHSELCYDSVDVHKCYGLKACQDCNTCANSAFLRDCIGCNDCFLSVGLRNARYVFENKQLSKEEYFEKMKGVDLGSYKQYSAFKTRLRELEKDHVFKEYHGNNLQNCLGDYLNHCRDAKYCFDCEDVEGAKYCYQMVLGSKMIYDIYQFGSNLQMSYECFACGENSYHLLFSYNGQLSSNDLYYCWYLESCKNCFGCANAKNLRYCILNKQYTQEEYEKLVPKIISHMIGTGEWGENFSYAVSPHGYNKSMAQLYYPLDRDAALAQGFKWDDYETPPPKVSVVVKASELADNIKDATDLILDAAIECEVTGRLFKITAQELKFYQTQGLPLPRRCFNQRHLDRFAKRNPRRFWERKCEKCGEKITTTYAPDAPYKVYCEKCYVKRLY